MRPHVHDASAMRYDTIDALRGFAMVWMTAFHFCFDLNHFGYIRQDFYNDPVWTWQRTCILSLFLFTAGLGQAVALHQNQPWPKFWRRWGQVAACALLVTLSSYWMYPGSFIYFGTLHGILLMLIVVRLSAGWGRWLWLAGALAIAIKFAGASALIHSQNADLVAVFNSQYVNWLGFITAKPITEDYVPLFPWLGLMWWGMAAGQWLLRVQRKWFTSVSTSRSAGFGALALLGRWSLSYYMVHQPVMIGLLAAFAWCLGK